MVASWKEKYAAVVKRNAALNATVEMWEKKHLEMLEMKDSGEVDLIKME